MLSNFLTFFNSPMLRTLPTEDIPWGTLIAELVIALLLFVFMFIFRRRFLKILCGCGSEVCLFLACKLAFGPDALLTQIMCWVTAAVACIVTVSIVNRINWSKLQAKS
ncbi:MAG: hypothetical protein IJA91_05605 [Clostridia bacterium]|nr:hypothetical protein [Clostridia bacterium]